MTFKFYRQHDYFRFRFLSADAAVSRVVGACYTVTMTSESVMTSESPSSYRDVIDGDSGHRSRVTPQLADVGQPEQVPDDAGAVPRAWGGTGRCYKGGVVNIRPAGTVSGGITYHIFILKKCYKRVISHHNQYKNTSTFKMTTGLVPNLE